MTIQTNEYFGEVISTYTRAQAITDGVLIDVTETAKEFHFKVPVAITSTVWQGCINWSNDTEVMYQDESGRLHDILWMCFIAIHKNKSSQCLFDIYRIQQGEVEPTSIKLKSVISGGDEGEPVITIMLPEED